MTTLRQKLAVLGLAAPVFLFGSQAQALVLNGLASLGYVHNQQRVPSEETLKNRTLMQTYAAGFSGAFLPRGDLSASLQATYTNVGDTGPTGKRGFGDLGFEARINVADRRPTKLKLNAQRRRSSTTNEMLAQERVGETTTTRYRADAESKYAGLPRVGLSLESLDHDTANLFGDQTRSQVLNGRLGISQETSHLRYHASTSAALSRGDGANTSYQGQQLTLGQSADLSRTSRFSAGARVYRRQAGALEAGNADVLSSGINAVLSHRHTSHLRSSHSYSFGQSTFDDRSSNIYRKQLNHGFNNKASYNLDADWSLTGGLALSRIGQVSNNERRDAWSEQADVATSYQHTSGAWSGNASASLSGALTQREGSADRPGYGAGVGLGGAWRGQDGTRFRASLSAGHSESVGLTARNEKARLQLTASTRAQRALTLLAELRGSYGLRVGELTGRSRSRAVQGELRIELQRWGRAGISASFSDGASQALENPVDPDFVPQRFNIRSRSANAYAQMALFGDLSIHLRASAVRIQAPSTRQRSERAEAHLSYKLGKITLAARNIASWQDSGSRRAFANVFYVTAARSFGTSLPWF